MHVAMVCHRTDTLPATSDPGFQRPTGSMAAVTTRSGAAYHRMGTPDLRGTPAAPDLVQELLGDALRWTSRRPRGGAPAGHTSVTAP
jgi:hypothetical protein